LDASTNCVLLQGTIHITVMMIMTCRFSIKIKRVKYVNKWHQITICLHHNI